MAQTLELPLELFHLSFFFSNLTLIVILKVLSICDTILKNALFLGRNWQPSLDCSRRLRDGLGSFFVWKITEDK